MENKQFLEDLLIEVADIKANTVKDIVAHVIKRVSQKSRLETAEFVLRDDNCDACIYYGNGKEKFTCASTKASHCYTGKLQKIINNGGLINAKD